MKPWILADGEEFHRVHPDTFAIPTRQERWTVSRGHCAKLMFLPRGEPQSSQGFSGERMWVEVESQREDGAYIGRLRNAPLVFQSLAFDDEIEFEPRHVIAITGPPRDPER